MAVGTLSRDEIAAIFNSTEDYTQQANMAPYRPGLSREEIANFYNAPTASNTPAPAQPVSQPTQALPTLDPALAERERQMDEAKTIGRQALKYAQEGKLAQRDPAVSANEQRDIERAQKAQEEAAKRRESARTAQTSVEPAERVNNEDVEVPTNPNARLAKRPRKGAQGIDMGPDVVEATETKEQKNKGTFKNNLTAEDQARVEEINKDIARLSAHRSQVNDRRISGLQAERDQLIGQTLSQGRNDQADTMAKWLDPDYKMTDSEVEQAKQIISDYENTEYKNANVVDLTADEQARQSQINALRDKVSKERGAEYGSLNATVNPLLTLGDRDYYGWSVDDLRSEVENQGDVALSPEVQEYVDQLKGEIDGLQNTLNNKGTVYSTGDAAVDEVIGANTNMTEGDVRKTLEEKEMQMYKLMLEASRGNDQPDYDSYSFRKQNAQKQNPAAYFAGDLATRAIESAAIQGAAGSNGFGADMLVDMATDTLPELSANKAAGMSDKEAWNQAGKNMLLNTLIDAGVWGLQNAGTIKNDFTNPPGGPPTLQPEVQPATVENLLKQNDVDINAKIDNVNNAVDEIEDLAKQATESDALSRFRDTLSVQRENILKQIETSNLYKYQRNNAINHLNDIKKALDFAESPLHTRAEGLDTARNAIHSYIKQMAENGVNVDDEFIKSVDDYFDEIKALKFGESNTSEAGIKQIPDVPEEVIPDDSVKGDYMADLRQAFDTADPATKAEMLVDGGYYDDMIEAGKAYQNGELDGAVEDFLAKMERNGDPTSAKRVVDSNTYDHQALKEQYGGDWEAMRRGTIKEYTGVDDAKADEYYDALRRFVGGGYPGKNDTAILDDYVSKAPTYQGQITRGMHFNPEDGSYDEFMKQVHDSGTVTLGKPSSWATNPDSARVYSHMGDDGVDSIEIVCNKNRTSSPIDFINGQGEDEVISSSNASWTVLNEETYTRPNGSRKTIIRVAETGDKTPPKDAVVMPDQNVEAPKQGAFSTPQNPIPDDSVKGAGAAQGEFTNPDSQKILDAYRAGERLSEADQDILEMALLEEKYGNLRRYSDDVVTVEKSEIPDDVLREMMGNNYEMQLESVKLGPELAKRGYNIWENGFHNNIMENFSVLQDAVAHHLADDLIPAKTMAEAYDITYQNGGTLDDAIRLAAEMSGTKLSNPTNAEGILLRGAAQADTPKVNMPTPENPIPDASELPQGEQQTLDDILKLDTDNGGNVPPTNETDIPKPDMGFDPNDPYVVDPNAVRQQEMTPPSPKTRNSRLGKNTMRALDGAEQNAEDLSRGIYRYETSENKATILEAGNQIAASPTKAYNDLLSKSDEAFTAVDVDKSMMLRNKIKNELAAAREAGDVQQTNYLQSQLDALTIRQRKAATNAGQVSQAWAKWSRDADGAVFASYNIASRQMEDALKNDPRLGEMAKKIADSVGDDVEKLTSDELWEQLANADLSKTGEDELSVQIQKIIRNVLDKEANAKVKRNLQDRNIKKIADALAVELRQGEDIGETLDMLEQAGVTGFTGIDDSVEQEIRDLFDEAAKFGFNSKQRIELEDQAYARLAQELNLTGGFYDKVDSIRYFAMLANPKTHLRNVIGNYTFGQMTNFKDQLGGFLEDQVDKLAINSQARKAIKNGYEGDIEDLIPTLKGIDRTNTVIFKNGRDHDLYRAAFNDFDENAYRQLVHGDKYVSSERGIENAKNIWGYGKAGSAADRVMKNNSTALEAEDVFFKRQKYADALTRYLKANGADESVLLNDITDPATLDLLDRARKFAAERAEEATFQQKNSLADSLSRFSKEARNIDWSDAKAGQKAKKLAGLFLDATIPFKKTPLNILTSVGEYSPLQLWNVGQDLVGLAKHQQGAANKLIDDIAKTATGTSLLAAGYGLAKSGFITGGTDKDTSELDDLTGKQDYALNLGDLGSYTLDWLSPSLTVLLAGANLFESGLSAEGFSQMISNIGEPVLETTMLSSLVDVLRSAQYAESPMDTLVQAGATAGKNLATQFVPSELGNIARSIDNTRRSSYTDQTGVKGILDRTRRSVMNKLPGLSMLSEPYIDRWGEADTNLDGAAGENGLARLAYNHLSPGYYSPEEVSPREEYLYSLSEQIPQLDERQKLFPGAFGTSITVDGVTRKVTPEEKTTKDTAEGTARGEFVDAVMNDPEIQALSPELQTKIIEDLYGVAKHVGKDAIIDGYTTDDTAYNVYVSNGGDIPSLLQYEKDLRNPYGLKADAYSDMAEAGEDLTQFEGYPEAQEKYGINDTAAYREAYAKGGDEALSKEVDYQKALSERGLKDSDTARAKWTNSKEKGLEELVDRKKAFEEIGLEDATTKSAEAAYKADKLPEYKQYKDYIAEYKIDDTLSNWEEYQENGDLMEARGKEYGWSTLGLAESKETTEAYEHAKSRHDDLTPQAYAEQVKRMDADGSGTVSQEDLLKYLNRNQRTITDAKAQDLYATYGNWSRELYKNKDGKWAVRNKKD